MENTLLIDCYGHPVRSRRYQNQLYAKTPFLIKKIGEATYICFDDLPMRPIHKIVGEGGETTVTWGYGAWTEAESLDYSTPINKSIAIPFSSEDVRTQSQCLAIYLRADSVKGTLVDPFNATIRSLPSITKGMCVELILRLFDGEGQRLTGGDLEYASWDFCAADDWDNGTTPQLRTVDDIFVQDDEIHIIIEANSLELSNWLGKTESKTIGCELIGFKAGNILPDFVLQWDINVRNRRGDAGNGTPTPVTDGTYSAAQVNALVSAPFLIEYSADGSDWHLVQLDDDHYKRWKNSVLPQTEWNIEKLPSGPPGRDGVDSFLYVAYAENASGSSFSPIPNPSLKYRAEFKSDQLIASPSLSDFNSAGAVWQKYLGDDGLPGTGDMDKTVYDRDNDGIVNAADFAASAPWSGITSVPTVFPPEVHVHATGDLLDMARQRKIEEANPTTLYLSHEIIENSLLVSSGNLVISFPYIKENPNGEFYQGTPGDVFTWEYWVRASVNIGNITFGNSMAVVNMPPVLELTGIGVQTYHVIVIRGVYKSGVANNLRLLVNYAYSVEV